MSFENQSAVDFRVGIMSFAALCIIVMGVTFAGGDKGLLFAKTGMLKAHLNDVGGLKKGSSVTIGGMPIGKVIDITMVAADGVPKIEVLMSIRNDMKSKIKKDSIPTIKTQGMLGDRYLEIASGKSRSETISDTDILEGTGSADFDKTLQQANDTLAETTRLLTAINHQEGTAGQLIYKDTIHKNLTEITAELEDVLADFKKNPRRYIKLSVF